MISMYVLHTCTQVPMSGVWCFLGLCASKASSGIITMPVVLAEREDEQSCSGNRQCTPVSGFFGQA